MQTLADLYGVEVDYYLRINFAGFMSIVDAVGGVDVYSDYTFTSVGSPGYYDPTDFVEGWNHLDGQAALAFARERHAFASGDVQRGINQMKVIQAMVDKLKSPTLLLSYSKLMSAVSDCFVTNLSSEQISALVKMQLSSGADWQIESFTATGASAYSTKCYSAKGQKLYVMTPDDASVAEGQALIDAVWNGTLAADTEEETAESTASSAA
jgi:anionic cell wall polymer biosynthesis LytR-Cps2A-Psr (LCP) family protein